MINDIQNVTEYLKTFGNQLRFLPSELVTYLVANGRDVPPDLALLAQGRVSQKGKTAEAAKMELVDAS